MIISYIVSGFKVFNQKVELSYRANKKIKNKDYVFNINNEEILKSAILYGPNNTGKSSLIDSIEYLKRIVKTGKIIDELLYMLDFNFFNEKKEINYEIEFVENNDKFKYILSFVYKQGITDEKLYVNDAQVFDRFGSNSDSEMQNAINLISSYNTSLIISTLPTKYIKYNNDINNFFDKIIILKRDIDFSEVIGDIALLNKDEFRKFSNVMKSADVSINGLEINEELGKNSKELKLFSEYIMNKRKVSMPSYITDSDGTKAFMYYMFNIQKALKTGGIIIIDEIDRSLHTLLTKNIISIFNDEKNKNVQLLATSHDLLLLDCLYLFRKDQIWFTYKDEKEVYLYSLDNFKSNIDNQIRNKTMESYLKGLFGALPHPNIEEYIFDE